LRYYLPHNIHGIINCVCEEQQKERKKEREKYARRTSKYCDVVYCSLRNRLLRYIKINVILHKREPIKNDPMTKTGLRQK